MTYYDAHTHLNAKDLFPDRQQYLDQFINVWWAWLVNIGVDDYYNQKAIEIAQQVAQDSKYTSIFVKAAIWLHPWEVWTKNITASNLQEKFKQVKDLYENNKQHIVAIGEIWIDTHYPWTMETLELQKQLFSMQCDRAKELWLPIVIHSRSNFEATFEVLQNYTDLVIYFHCRWYEPKEIKILKANFKHLYIWFCWNISYDKAQNIRDSLIELTKDWDYSQVVLETDAPYLSPQQVRKEKNKPSFIPYLYTYVANLLSISESELQRAVEKNFFTLYKK